MNAQTIERVREHEWDDDKSSRCEGKSGTFGADSNTWRARPLDVIVGLTQAFSLGQELVVYTARTRVFGGMSAGWVNMLPAPFGCCNDLGLCRRSGWPEKGFFFFTLQERLVVVGWGLLLLHLHTHISCLMNLCLEADIGSKHPMCGAHSQ